MEDEVRKFVAEIYKDAPPRVVVVSYSGHGIQDGASILMVPSGASKEPDELKRQGFSHNELFKILHDEIHKHTAVRAPLSCPEQGGSECIRSTVMRTDSDPIIICWCARRDAWST